MGSLKNAIAGCTLLGGAVLGAGDIDWSQWQAYHHKDLTVQAVSQITVNAPAPVVKGKVLPGKTVTVTPQGVNLQTVLKTPKSAEYPAVLVKKITLERDQVFKLGCGADWWFEAWCNGRIAYSTFRTGGNDAWPPKGTDHIMALDLKKGENIVAIYLVSGDQSFMTAIQPLPGEHPAGTVSQRLEYESMFPARLELRHGPYLIAPQPGEVTVVFMSKGASGGAVEYRKKGAKLWSRKYDTRGGFIQLDKSLHRITLAGLQPGAEYEYRVLLTTDGKRMTPMVAVYSFAAPAGNSVNSFSFFVTGDTQFGANQRGMLLKTWQKHISEAAFHVNLGDLGYRCDDFDQIIFGGYLNYLTPETYHGKPFVAVRGNHELRGLECGRWFDLLSPDLNKGYYAFRYGEVFFVVLDASGEVDFKKPDDMTLYMQKQYKFLQELVDSQEYANARYRIVMAHGAPHSHKRVNVRLTTEYLMQPLLKAAKSDPAKLIQLYLAGHIHLYRRSVPGSTAVYSNVPVPADEVAGGNDVDFTILTCAGPDENPRQVASGTVVKVTPEHLEIKTYNEKDQCFDHLLITPDGKVIEKNNKLKNEFLKLYK